MQKTTRQSQAHPKTGKHPNSIPKPSKSVNKLYNTNEQQSKKQTTIFDGPAQTKHKPNTRHPKITEQGRCRSNHSNVNLASRHDVCDYPFWERPSTRNDARLEECMRRNVQECMGRGRGRVWMGGYCKFLGQVLLLGEHCIVKPKGLTKN